MESVMSSVMHNSTTLLPKLCGSFGVFSESAFQSCHTKGYVLKYGCLLRRNTLCLIDPHLRPIMQLKSRQLQNVCQISGFQQPWNPLLINSRHHLRWNTDFIPDLQRFLSEIGTDPKEARFWLKQFLNVNHWFSQKKPFAVIELESEVFTEPGQLEQLASAVSFLQRNSLRPVLVYESEPEGARYRRVSFEELRAASVTASCALCESLEYHGVQSKVLYAGSNTIVATESCRNSSSKVKAINPELIHWCMVQQVIPIIPALGETPSGQIRALDAWEVSAALTVKLQPLKVIKVSCRGGFKDEQGIVIANINLPFDLQRARDRTWCNQAVMKTITEVSALLMRVPEHTSVVITAADKVLQELFTHRGSGTFLKITEPIHKHQSLKTVDLDRLTSLLAKSFRRPLAASYFRDIQDMIHTIYLSERYTAAAIVLRLPGCDVPYLCKFAVSGQAQGEGTGKILWDLLRKDHKQLFWRSRGSNPVNHWYFKKSEGSWSNGTWTMFWYGIAEPSLSSALIKKALLVPESFLSATSATESGPSQSTTATSTS